MCGVVQDSASWFDYKATLLIRKFGVVLLQRARNVRVGVGHGDHRVALSRLRERAVIDASDADTEGCECTDIFLSGM